MANEKHEFLPREEPPLERRADERVTSVYRPVLIEAEDFAGFCLVRNLAAGGMMGSVFAEFAQGQPISVVFHPDYIVPGTVQWSRDGKIGIAFDARIDVEEVLRELSAKYRGNLINRSPRLEIACEGRVDLDGRLLPIQLRDISQRGIKAEASLLKVDDEVTVQLPGLELRMAVVKWTQGGVVGLNFVRPLSFEQLATWVIEQQSVRARRSGSKDESNDAPQDEDGRQR